MADEFPNVTIVSMFRDSAGGLLEYVKRIKALEWPEDHLRFVWVEGDSVDNTFKILYAIAAQDERISLIVRDTGMPRFPSVVHPERFKVLAHIYNAGLGMVDYDWTHYVLMLHSDIRYEPDMLMRLASKRTSIVAPFIWQNGQFYDIWGFASKQLYEDWGWTDDRIGFNPFSREDGERYTELMEMDTVGSVMLIHADVIRSGVRFTPPMVDRGFCHWAKGHGFGVWADPTTHVFHGPVMSY